MSTTPPNPADGETVTLLSASCSDWVSRLSRAEHRITIGLALGLCGFSGLGKMTGLGPIMGLCPTLAHVLGIWMLTSPEPEQSTRSIGTRSLIRRISLVAFVSESVLVALGYLPDANYYVLRSVVLIPTRSVQLILGGYLIASLAERIPDVRLANQSRFFSSNIVILQIVVGGFSLYVDRNDSLRESLHLNTAFATVFIPVFVYTFYVIIRYFMVLHRFSKLTRQAAARTNGRD